MKKYAIGILLLLLISPSLLVKADDCQKPPCEINNKHPETAAMVGSTAAAGLFAAPFGLESALTSMSLAGGVSLLTSAVTNTDQKMFVKLQNRSAKAVKKKKADDTYKDIREGSYNAEYGSCKGAPQTFELKSAGIDMNSAHIVTYNDVPHAALIIKDGTINIFDESGKKVVCNGFIKPGSHSKNIVLYCVDGGRGFCNKTYKNSANTGR